ncbi:phage terminase large subunit [Candidatus Nitronereus thalassa]|uniref:Phage terminase large subunit n=1 Tax=Candidatus Nitronereus thalassa TaxID=3020898 RepID=A0ABU3K325_9BACT|nr:phage terminase large subunit [Candidatus Nitronereus thalassa]MDT7040792.1 phage terminase large subunit [Candidatus Nitronereus thalassa]
MMSDDEKRVFHALLRADLEAFIAKAFQIVSPGDVFLSNWHITVIADFLMRVYRGEITRLLITMPPRSLKSICVSIAFVAWLLGKDPTKRIINVSYGYELASKLARDTRAVMESEFYRQVFPWTQLMRNAELDLETTQKGIRYATSVGGSLTGRGGNLLIIDDPAKPQDMLSKVKRDTLKQWYDGTLYSRLDNKVEGAIIHVMQRLHVDDLVAHVLGKERWVHLNLPAIAEFPQSFTLSDGRIWKRKPGSLLHPERESMEVLEAIQSMIGSYNFSAQYQQQPVPEDGNLIKWKWFQRYDTPPAFERGDKIVQSWDTASKAAELADYSVCTTWHQKGDDYYLLEVLRLRLDYPDLRKMVISHAQKFFTHTLLIEDTASGMALIQDIRDMRIDNFPRPIGIKPQGEKVMRLSNHSATIEAGHVHLPQKASWLEEFKAEFLAFPQAHYDDQVDSVSQFLTWQVERRRHYIAQGDF